MTEVGSWQYSTTHNWPARLSKPKLSGWNQLWTVSRRIHSHLAGDPARDVFDRVTEVAEKQGKAIYDELAQIHWESLIRERETGSYAFAARRRAVEPSAQVTPEMVPLLLIRLDGNRG